jgi:hypothetical protein
MEVRSPPIRSVKQVGAKLYEGKFDSWKLVSAKRNCKESHIIVAFIVEARATSPVIGCFATKRFNFRVRYLFMVVVIVRVGHMIQREIHQ